MFPSAERERECGRACVEELDREHAVDDLLRLPHQLVHARLVEDAFARVCDVGPRRNKPCGSGS